MLPDSGLLFWMLISFGIVFFALAKFGFPFITRSVEKRRNYIETSLTNAKQAEEKLAGLQQEGASIIEGASKEQGRILREASALKEKMILSAKEEASKAAADEIEAAKALIAKEKDEAVYALRREVAALSCDIAEKVVRQSLDDRDKQMALIEKMLQEMGDKRA